MARPQKIMIPIERPRTCEECSLCGHIPPDEIPYGGKWTRKCLLPEQGGRLLSGRGCKTPTARNRCSPREYQKQWIKWQGEIPVSATAVVKYKIGQRELIFAPQCQVENHINRKYARHSKPQASTTSETKD